MKHRLLNAAGAVIFVLSAGTAIFAQGTTPTPGPTDPTPRTQTEPKPGTDLVVNPKTEECKQGWNSDMKWTKEKFEQFCAAMRAAK